MASPSKRMRKEDAAPRSPGTQVMVVTSWATFPVDESPPEKYARRVMRRHETDRPVGIMMGFMEDDETVAETSAQEEADEHEWPVTISLITAFEGGRRSQRAWRMVWPASWNSKKKKKK